MKVWQCSLGWVCVAYSKLYNFNETVNLLMLKSLKPTASEWSKQRDRERDKASGWKCRRDRSCSPSRESSCGSLIQLCLVDKRVFDNLMHGRAIHASTIYIHSSLLGTRSCHPTHAGIITVFSVHPSSACVRTCELKAETPEPRATVSRLLISP